MKQRILNAGCGKETFGTHFIDLYPQRPGVKKIDANHQKLPYPQNYFHKIYCKNLFEHLNNPLFFLRQCKRVLKPGATLELTTDNAAFWLWHNQKGRRIHYGGYEKNSEGGKDDKHYALYTPNHLANWLQAAGFKEMEWWYDGEQKDLAPVLQLANAAISRTRFAPMAFPKISLEAIK